jgi:hypothetical protein
MTMSALANRRWLRCFSLLPSVIRHSHALRFPLSLRSAKEMMSGLA